MVSLKILKWLLFFILSLIKFCHSILMFSHCGFMHKAVERVKRRFDPFTINHSPHHSIVIRSPRSLRGASAKCCT
ncbi:MAG: hypothetical protein ISS63_11810 [Desulfobacteraceae bacterium]|nr:hypothetical protein [Desulfobacteraceae bacterium]